MILDVMKSWFAELASVPDLAAFVAIGAAILFVLWLVTSLAGRRAHRRTAKQLRDLEQRVVMMEARRERDILRTARTPTAETEIAAR